VIVQPLVTWLWIGGGIMAAGTVLAAFPGRRRNPIDPVSALLPDPGAGAAAEAPSPVAGGRRRPGEDAGPPGPPGDGDGDGAGDRDAGRRDDEPQPIEVTT
jgi:hypothetical protein